MLTSITLKNFKSYKDTTLKLAPLTLMIGANASGKTNAIEALRLINWIIRKGKTDDINRFFDDGTMRGTLSSLYRDIKQGIEFEIEFSDNKKSKNSFSFKLENVDNTCQITSENLYQNSNPIYTSSTGIGKDKYTKHVSLSDSENILSWTSTIVPLHSLFLDVYQILFATTNEINETGEVNPLPSSYLNTSKEVATDLKNMVFLDSLPCKMRGYVDKTDDDLTHDGSNLSAVIYKLCNDKDNKKGNKKALLNFIKSLPEQNISGVRFIETHNDDVMVQLVETFGKDKRTMAASLLSDGTLRVLAIGALLLSAPEGTLLVIEEIDNGVHPSRIHTLMEKIKDIATRRKLQVLITSHNPALLDAIPNSSLEDVVCCYRDKEEGDSRLIRLGDMHKYPELIAQGTLGELVTDSIIDRYIHDKTTPEEDTAKRLAWLKDFQKDLEGQS